MASAVLAASLLARLAGASVLLYNDGQALYGATLPSGPALRSPRGIEARSDHNSTFDIGWQVQDQPLFSANWTGGTGYIPIGGPVPVESSATDSFSLSVECNDCRAFGSILTDFNDDAGLIMSLTFNDVGVLMDFGVFANQGGTFTIGLGRFFGDTPAGQNIEKIFSATVGIGIDLVLSFTGGVTATGGFQIEIPDKEQIGLVLQLPDEEDLLAGNFNVSASLDLVPEINFAILPVQLSHASVNITAAIVLRAEAGITLQKTALTQNVDFAATVSASLTLAQLTFGSAFTDGEEGACKQALFVEVDSNAAAGAVVGSEIAGNELDRGPDVSTIFLSAGTTTCLDDPTSASSAPTTTGQPACPTTALVTSVANMNKTFSLTSCLVSALNCPTSLTQVIVVTDVQPATTTTCTSLPNATTTVAPAVFYTPGSITLTPLRSPVTTSLAPALFANVTAPINATLAGVAVAVPVLTTPPPTATELINVGGKNDSRPVATTSKAGGLKARGGVDAGLAGWLGVLVLGVVLL